MCFALSSPQSIHPKMRVAKRSGTFEEVNFEKIAKRIKKLSWNLDAIDASVIVAQVASSLVDGIETEAIDHLTAEIAISKNADHPDYGKLASRISMSNIHKKTNENVLETYETMESALHPSFLALVRKYAEELQRMIVYKRDYDFDFFGIKTLERMYCTKIGGKLIERPQHMYLRVALAIGRDDLTRVKETYDLLSKKFFTHASPTLFNSGMNVQQCASCFLDSSDDSLDGIFECFHRCARISKFGGGLGVNVSSVRSKGAPIHSTNGTSDGIIPMLKVANSIACYINQGGKRKGSMAVYLEPHHPDVLDFLNLRRPGGDEEMRCRDLFLAMWVSDEFMRRVEAGEKWSLLDPAVCPGLDDAYGDEFTTLYKKYEDEGKASKVVEARDVWNAILTSQIESGVPYILNKDACNMKSNQKNLGTIKSSNLCVAPETLVLTQQGHKRIDTLCDSPVDVWNGFEWSTTTVKKTNDRAELLRVTMSGGQTLECTPYHKFYTSAMVEKRASELVTGDLLLDWEAPVMEFEDGSPAPVKNYVEKVEYTGRMDATYCFNEPKRHMGVFNGILTGNCAEILEYSSPGDEVAVCTLASIGLPAFVKHGSFDFDELHRVTKVVARNLDTVIDINHYPIEEARVSNMRHRPVGIGIQGLADTFIKLRLPFESPAALDLNQRILATMYHAALELSTELAAVHGPYPTFKGSPASMGILQYDAWNVDPVDGLDWDDLKRRISEHGLRNSLSIALMPTASTAQLLGNSEAAEPVTSLYYVRRTLAGEYACIHKYLLDELVSRDLWTPTIKNAIIRDGGSIQNIYEIPRDVRELYKTSYDIKQRVIIDQAAARGPYVCQSQSMNLFVAAPTFAKLTSMHFHSWKAGLKTINYYLRSKPASRAAQVTLDSSSSSSVSEEEDVCVHCSG